MNGIPERRKHDPVINEIALNVRELRTRQEDYIKQIDTCTAETKDNGKDITTLKTKMGFVTYVGSGAFIVTAGAFVKKWFFTHPPPT